jgi:hypothetical protein
VVGLLQRLPDKTVVVDLAIDGEDNALVGIGKGLSSALCVFLLGDIFEAGDTGQDAPTPTMLSRSWHRIVLWQVTLPPVKVPKCQRLLFYLVTPGREGRKEGQTHSNRVPYAGCCEISEVNCAVRFADPGSNSELTYALDSFRAVDLNLTTSGWLSPG